MLNNNIDLHLQALQHAQLSSKRRKTQGYRTLGNFPTPKYLEAEYKHILRTLVNDIYLNVKKTLYDPLDKILPNPVIQINSPASIIQSIFDGLFEDSAVYVAATDVKMKRFINQMDDREKDRFYRRVKDSVGVDIRSVIKSPNVQDQIQLATQENFSLIKTLATTELERIQSIVYTQLTKGIFDTDVLRKLMRNQYGVSKRHADFIARDQTFKINGNLNRIRSEAIGCDKYIWHVIHDMRTRGRPGGFYPNAKHDHWARDTKVFYYARPPAGGNPGQDYNCRCSAEPILPKIFQG